MTWPYETGEDDAAAQIKAFCDAGGTLVDTADKYGDGVAEEILGRLLREVVPRDEVLVATKAYQVTGPGPMGRGTSRGHLLSALDASLRRLQVEHVDLWQMHAWDRHTPWEETLAAIDSAVASGKVRYAGVSNYTGWQVAATAVHQRAVPGRTPLVSDQVEYSLLARGVEAEVVPAAKALGVGILPWSPLGQGVLSGKYRGGTPADSRATGALGGFAKVYTESDRVGPIVDAVVTAADGLGVSPVAVALSWVRDRPGVVAPVVGARTAAQLKAALGAEGLTLPAEIRSALDDVSAPPRAYGPFAGWSSEDLETSLD